MLIPQRKKTPDRLFDTYTFEQKSQVVKGFLFDGKSIVSLTLRFLALTVIKPVAGGPAIFCGISD